MFFSRRSTLHTQVQTAPGPINSGGIQRARLSLLVFVSALVALLLLDTDGGLMAGFLLGKLAHSTSNAAALLLLGYTAAALLVLGRSTPASSRTSRRAAGPTLTALGAAYLAHLAASLRYWHTHQLPADRHVWHWLGSDNTYTALLNSHLGKPAIHQAFSALGLPAGSYDTGRALAQHAPEGLVLIIALGFCVALIAALAALPGVMQRLQGRAAALALTLVSSVVCLQTVLDGGLLSQRAPISLFVLASLLLARDRAAFARFWRGPGWRLALVLVAAHLALWSALSAERPFPTVGGLLFTLGLYALLILRLSNARAPWATTAIAAYLAANLWLDAELRLAPLLRPFDATHRVARLTPDGAASLPDTAPLHGRSSQLGGRAGQGPVQGALSIAQTYRRLGDDPRKPRHILIWSTAAASGAHTHTVEIRLLDIARAAGALPANPALWVDEITPAPHGRLRLRFSVAPGLPPLRTAGAGNALSQNNHYVYLHALNALLQRGGWREYILLPVP